MREHSADPGTDDAWFSQEQRRRLEPAAAADTLGAAVPTRNVSNGEYVPFAQTPAQREVEERVATLARQTAQRLGVSRRRFLSGAGGMAASFVAMNEVFGHFFDASAAELVEPGAAAGHAPPAARTPHPM